MTTCCPLCRQSLDGVDVDATTFRIWPDRRLVTCGAQSFYLSRQSFAFAAALWRAYPRPVEIWALAEVLWPNEADRDGIDTLMNLRTYAARLRKSLAGKLAVEAIYGTGYRLQPVDGLTLDKSGLKENDE